MAAWASCSLVRCSWLLNTASFQGAAEKARHAGQQLSGEVPGRVRLEQRRGRRSIVCETTIKERQFDSKDMSIKVFATRSPDSYLEPSNLGMEECKRLQRKHVFTFVASSAASSTSHELHILLYTCATYGHHLLLRTFTCQIRQDESLDA
ncbi:hypothetical protein BCR44DRAFT_348245 [Catenaria anguillulae PL171]|uniref:Uncharacterized protein n=1 Tax=Catenaria anguillulae PL171 TaxID=765915 RepID=A0A1Y2I556_9FUNG|nr:hypothetical protein BCR44DRAFT_348245 [Catenaria anguillulae PL171]